MLRAIDAWLATPRSRFRSSGKNFFFGRSLSSWMTPRAWPSCVHSGAHQRAHGQSVDALAAGELLGQVVAQDRLHAVQALPDDDVAERGVGEIAGLARPGHAGDQLAGGFVPQDEETPVGLRKEFQQAVDEAGQEGVDFERVAEAVADFQDDAEPLGGLGLQKLDAAWVIDGMLDGERGVRRLVEGADEVADADAVVLVELDAPRERHNLVVDEGFVAALSPLTVSVFDGVFPIPAGNNRMAAADAGAGVVAADPGFLDDDDVAFGVAAEDGLVAVQRETQAGFAAADENEVGHGIPSGTKAQGGRTAGRTEASGTFFTNHTGKSS